MPVSRNNSWISLRRHWTLLRKYSDSPERKMRRATVTSVKSTGKSGSVLSKVSRTSAIECGERREVPLKITSAMDVERKDFQEPSPMHQRMDSTTLDLP